MREFFRGWRRKAGCLLLLAALCVMIVWLRSQLVTDSRFFKFRDQQFVAQSRLGSFSVLKVVAWHFSDSEMTATSVVWRVNYLLAAGPLAGLSAFLLLGRQRKPGK